MRKRVNEKMYSIGSHIRAARRRADFTQEQLSEMIGVTPQYLSDLERGIVGTSINTLMEICTKLNVSADYILFGDESENGSTNATLIEKIQRLPRHRAELIETGIDLLLEAIDLDPERDSFK